MQHEILTGSRTTLLTARLDLVRLVPPTVRLLPLATRTRHPRRLQTRVPDTESSRSA